MVRFIADSKHKHMTKNSLISHDTTIHYTLRIVLASMECVYTWQDIEKV